MITKEKIYYAADEYSTHSLGMNASTHDAFSDGANWAIKELSGLIELRETEADQSENWAKHCEAELEKGRALWEKEKAEYEAKIHGLKASEQKGAWLLVRWIKMSESQDVEIMELKAEIARLKSQLSDNKKPA